MFIENFKTDVIVFIDNVIMCLTSRWPIIFRITVSLLLLTISLGDKCDVIMCFTSDWPINWRMRVTNWPNIFVHQGQFSDPDLISCTHQRVNVPFADELISMDFEEMFLSLLTSMSLLWASVITFSIYSPSTNCLSISKSLRISRWQLFNACCCFGSIPIIKINNNWLNLFDKLCRSPVAQDHWNLAWTT